MQQIDSKDCSLIVLNWFHNYHYQKTVSLNKLKANVTYSDYGVSVKQLQDLSYKLNIKLQSFKCDFNVFDTINKKELPFGALIEVNNMQHMVIITKIKANQIFYFDPIYGAISITKKNFMSNFLGIVFKFSKIKTNNKSIANENHLKIKFHPPYLLILLISLTLKLATPFVTKILLGNIYFSHSYYDLMIILLIFVWMQISSQLFYVLAYKIVNRSIINASYKKNKKLLEIIKNNPDKTLFKYSDPEIINRFSAIKETIEFDYTFWSDVVVDLLTVIISFAFLYFANNLVLIVCLAYSLLSLFISFFVTKKTKFYYAKLREKIAIYNNNIYGVINYLRTNNNHNYYKFLNTKTENSLSKLNNKSFKNFSFLNFWNSIVELFTNMTPFAIYLIAIISFWGSGKQLQEFIFYLTGISLITIPIKSINTKIMSWKNNEHNVFLLETFDYFLKHDFKKLEKLSSKNNYFIEINDLIFKLKGKKIIDISKITIEQNTYITGKNGKGKSTLIKLIMGIYNKYQGEILLNSDDEKYNIKNWYYEFGFATSEEYFPNLTVKEYLTNNGDKVQTSNFEKITYKYDLNHAFEIMNINLDTFLINNASNLSTGQKKFLTLIKLLTIESKIIILDEAFENLDKNISKFLKECILNKFKNSLFIEISHNNNFVCENSKEFNIEKINKI